MYVIYQVGIYFKVTEVKGLGVVKVDPGQNIVWY